MRLLSPKKREAENKEIRGQKSEISFLYRNLRCSFAQMIGGGMFANFQDLEPKYGTIILKASSDL